MKRLRALKLTIRGSGPWQARCPAHADTEPSLSITEKADNVLLMHCWGGCTTMAVLDKLGLDLSVLYPSRYALQFGHRRHHESVAFRDAGDERTIEDATAEHESWKRLLRTWRAPGYAINQLAVHLHVARESFEALRVGYDPETSSWIFPERDDKRRIVGLVRRDSDDLKKAMSGSKRGLTIPIYGSERPSGPVYLAEGASDTAALHSVAVLAYGRFSATGSAAERIWLSRLLARHPKREIVVVGDRDVGGSGGRGAEALADWLRTALRRPVAWALPRMGFKDVREQIVAGQWKRGLSIQE